MHRLRTKGWNLLDHRWVFDAGDDPQRPAAGRTGLDVDAEDAFQPLRPSHCCPAFRRRFLLLLFGGPGFGALPPLPRCYPGAVSTVGGKYAMTNSSGMRSGK